jgi:hypothetical protein
MKSNIPMLIVVIVSLAACSLEAATDSPALRVSSPATNSVRLEWNSVPGTTYQVLITTNLTPISDWLPAGSPISASGTSASIDLVVTNSPINFFRLHALSVAGAGLPTARVVSHTNGEVVSGLTKIAVAAQDDSRLSMVTLLIDGIEYETSVTEGDLAWTVNTGHFSNGLHTVLARAADNYGIAYLGGNPDANVVANEVLSMPVALYFSNIVRWIEPEVVFDGTVPISIRSDVFPTNWTVFVENESGTVVRTFAGYTTDGIIETYWD